MDKLHGHHVSFLPFESSPDGVYHTTTLVTNTYNPDRSELFGRLPFREVDIRGVPIAKREANIRKLMQSI